MYKNVLLAFIETKLTDKAKALIIRITQRDGLMPGKW